MGLRLFPCMGQFGKGCLFSDPMSSKKLNKTLFLRERFRSPGQPTCETTPLSAFTYFHISSPIC